MTRILDIILSGLAMLVLLPLLLPIVIALRLTGEGEVFFVQIRVGKGGRPFGLFKFATMLKDSPNMPGGDITAGNDPRVLPLGHILRKTKINELPQLWNIFIGDISIVGPRPLTPRTFAYYSTENQTTLNEIVPGLTGIGSIVFRDEEAIIAASPKSARDCYKEDIAPYKGALELWYCEHRNFGLYLKLILLTAWVIILPRSRLVYRLFSDLPINSSE